MRVQIVAAILAGVLFLSSLLTFGFCAWYVLSARANIATQGEIVRVNAHGAAVRALLMESAEYSKRHPSMTPLLQSLNVLPRAPLPTNQAPAGLVSPAPSSN